MGIKHTKVSAKPDGVDPSLVQASDWNASHTIDGDVDVAGHILSDVGALRMTPGVDLLGPGVNMSTGRVDNYSDPNMNTHSMIIIKGADNEGTFVTGIDATGVVPGDVRYLINVSESGVDVGLVVLEHQDANSLAANRIICPGAQPYLIPIFGGCMLVYGDDSRWHVVEGTGWFGRTIKR